MLILKIIVISVVVLLFVVIFRIVNTSDFGESAVDLTEEEYEEICKAYNEYYNSRSKL